MNPNNIKKILKIMNFSKYTTQELEFITSNVELLKKELEKRYIKK